MKAWKMELHTGKNRIVRELLVLADTETEARGHVRTKYHESCPKHEIRNVSLVMISPASFVIGSWTTD